MVRAITRKNLFYPGVNRLVTVLPRTIPLIGLKIWSRGFLFIQLTGAHCLNNREVCLLDSNVGGLVVNEQDAHQESYDKLARHEQPSERSLITKNLNLQDFFAPVIIDSKAKDSAPNGLNG